MKPRSIDLALATFIIVLLLAALGLLPSDGRPDCPNGRPPCKEMRP